RLRVLHDPRCNPKPHLPLDFSGRLINGQQGTKMVTASLRQRVPADYKFLILSDLKFDPGASASAALVNRIWAFGDQPLEAKLLRDPEQIVFTAAELVREPDICRRFLKKVGRAACAWR